jgi:serine/threonine-protein kinase HipA
VDHAEIGVREEPWVWPRDLHPFFRQNLPEGYLLGVIREEFGPLLDGTDLSLLAVIGGTGIGRVTVTPEGATPGVPLEPLDIEGLLTAAIAAAGFSDPIPPESPPAVGRSELLARPRKAKKRQRVR